MSIGRLEDELNELHIIGLNSPRDFHGGVEYETEEEFYGMGLHENDIGVMSGDVDLTVWPTTRSPELTPTFNPDDLDDDNFFTNQYHITPFNNPLGLLDDPFLSRR